MVASSVAGIAVAVGACASLTMASRDQGGAAMELLAVAPELSHVQDVRARLVAAGWLDTSRQRRQRKIVRGDGVAAVALPVTPGVSAEDLSAAEFTDIVSAVRCICTRVHAHKHTHSYTHTHTHTYTAC